MELDFTGLPNTTSSETSGWKSGNTSNLLKLENYKHDSLWLSVFPFILQLTSSTIYSGLGIRSILLHYRNLIYLLIKIYQNSKPHALYFNAHTFFLLLWGKMVFRIMIQMSCAPDTVVCIVVSWLHFFLRKRGNRAHVDCTDAQHGYTFFFGKGETVHMFSCDYSLYFRTKGKRVNRLAMHHDSDVMCSDVTGAYPVTVASFWSKICSSSFGLANLDFWGYLDFWGTGGKSADGCTPRLLLQALIALASVYMMLWPQSMRWSTMCCEKGLVWDIIRPDF